MPATTTCPHCNRVLRPGSPTQGHLRSCIAEPTRYAAVRAALDDGAGVCVKPGRYEKRRGKLPTAGGLTRQLSVISGRSCGWAEVAVYYKLTPTTALVCPHCGRGLGAGRPMQVHLSACIANPVLRAAVREALDDGAGGCLTEGQWVDAGGSPSSTSLRGQVSARLGRQASWHDVAAHFGLEPSGRVVGRVEWALAVEGEKMDADQAEYWAAARKPWELNVLRVVEDEREVRYLLR